MKKEITITAEDMLKEDFSRQEMHAIASTMLDRLYNTPEIKTEVYVDAKAIIYESYCEWRKPYAVKDEDGELLGVALPEINAMVLPELLNGGKEDTWDNMMEHAENIGCRLMEVEEARTFQNHWDEVNKILKDNGFKPFDKEKWYWSSTQYNAFHSWYWGSTRWGNNYKGSSHVGIGVCALPR